MVGNDVDQLAAILKAAGLCASLFDAKNMAKSISEGTQKRHEEVEARIVKYMGSGKRDEGFEVIRERVGGGVQRPQPNSFIEEKMRESDKEVFVNKDSFGVEVKEDVAVAEIIKEDEEVFENTKPEPAQSSLSIFEEPNSTPDIVVEEPLQEQEVKTEVEPQPKIEVLKQEKSQEIIPVSKPQQQQPGPRIEVFKQDITQDIPVIRPQPTTVKMNEGFRELPVDKNRSQPQLTKEQKESTDLTKWFYFGKK